MKKGIPAFIAACFLLAACHNGSKETKAITDSTTDTMHTISTTQPASPPSNFKHAYATINSLTIHYVIGGSGNLSSYYMASEKTGIRGTAFYRSSPNILP